MQMALLAVVLWPKKTDKPFKAVSFKPGVINIITGQSGCGKSSLIHIVDYCLGSGKCSIPVGVIRDTVEWFGVHVQLANAQLLLGRRNPEDQEQSGDIFLVQADEIDLSAQKPEKNATVDFLKQRLNEFAGLPQLSFDPATSSGFKQPPSFRDLAAFTFQPQHIVANPHTLFFKTDTFEHREKLVTIFPLVLGALSGEQLKAKHQLHELQIDLDRKQQLVDRQLEAAREFTSQIRAFLARAQELGLLDGDARLPADAKTGDLLDQLRQVPKRLASGRLPRVDVGAANRVVARIRELENEEDALATNLSSLSRRKLQIERLRTSVNSYGIQLQSETAKLTGIDWFAKRVKETDQCPFCGNASEAALKAIDELAEQSHRMSQLSLSASNATPVLEKEANRLGKESRELETRLEKVRDERWGLEDQSVVFAEHRRTEVEAFRLSGRIEQALDLFSKTDPDSALAKSVSELNSRIAELRRISNPAQERVRLSGALQRFSQTASRYTEPLRLERGDDLVGLDVGELMVLISGKNDRKDALWEIGSAENWLGYHIATLLALHEEFLRLDHSFVPSFLMIDQPSQAYFPDVWPEDDGEKVEDVQTKKSADIAGVHRIFETLALAITRCKGKLQIIVTDHAGDITWQGIPFIHVIGNWREGKDEFLIPQDWIDDTVSQERTPGRGDQKELDWNEDS